MGLPAWMRQSAAENEFSVLLETSRFDADNYRSFLFMTPCRTITAHCSDDIRRVLREIDEALEQGLYVAGYLNYECGYSFEKLLPSFTDEAQPIAWFGVYEKPHVFDHRVRSNEGRTSGALRIGSEPARDVDHLYQHEPQIDRRAYIDKILAIKEHITTGDVYQINFTDRIVGDALIPPMALYECLSARQSVAFSAYVNLGRHCVVSLSPELFFRISNGRITMRPMKGTMAHGGNFEESKNAAMRLHLDQKNRSEHVMIVDLVRNDLGRICMPGSIEAAGLFSIEHYETVLQMTSTVTGVLRSRLTSHDLFSALFPSGSITGAPKLRSMQLIRELEDRPRGIYTGCLGYITPSRSAAFSVAIRTLDVADARFSMGVGGGIVADSVPDDEYDECRLKASFLAATEAFDLIETLGWHGRFNFLPLHLQRLEASARYFGYSFDAGRIQSKLADTAANLLPARQYRVRLSLTRVGDIAITTQEYQSVDSRYRVRIATERTNSRDPFLRHKTTRRSLYDNAYQQATRDGYDDFIFLNENDEITEGAIHNVLIEKDGQWRTPPVSCGVLPGVYRQYMIDTEQVVEAPVTLQQLRQADRIVLCNAIRGMHDVEAIDEMEWQPVTDAG